LSGYGSSLLQNARQDIKAYSANNAQAVASASAPSPTTKGKEKELT